MKTVIKNIEVSGQTVSYRVKGNPGESGIVFIHGVGADSRFFQKQLNHFGAFLTSIAIDLPGHGQSRRGAALTMENLTDSLLAVIEAENLKRVTLAGHSLGGLVAMDLYFRSPHLVEAMVLISTGARIPVSEFLQRLLDSDAEDFFRFLVRLVFSRQGDLMTSMAMKNLHLFDRDLFEESFAICRGSDFSGRLKDISVPVLAVANAGDKLLFPEISEELAKGIPGAEFILFDAGGHVPFFEYAHLFDVEMEAFLRKTFPGFADCAESDDKKALKNS